MSAPEKCMRSTLTSTEKVKGAATGAASYAVTTLATINDIASVRHDNDWGLYEGISGAMW